MFFVIFFFFVIYCYCAHVQLAYVVFCAQLTLAGTTDRQCTVEDHPAPTAEDVAWIIDELGKYLSVSVRREDVKAAWYAIIIMFIVIFLYC